jgi:hypothetical protein
LGRTILRTSEATTQLLMYIELNLKEKGKGRAATSEQVGSIIGGYEKKEEKRRDAAPIMHAIYTTEEAHAIAPHDATSEAQ